MPINYWRFVRNDSRDDGPNKNQCLQCYGEFAAFVGSSWKFCPLCGTRWIGQHPSEEIREEQELFERKCYGHTSVHKKLYPLPRKKIWVVEKRECTQLEKDEPTFKSWCVWHRLRGYTAQQALEFIRSNYRKNKNGIYEENFDREDDVDWGHVRFWDEVKLAYIEE